MKPMPHDALTLSPHTVEALFPFHFLLGCDDEQIVSVGLGLRELLPEDYSSLALDQLFEIIRPRNDGLTVSIIKQHLRCSFILKMKQSNIMLRGQFLVTMENTVLFIGSIVVSASNSLDKYGLSLKMFAPFDLTPDIVIMHKFREIELADRQKRSERLSEMSRSHDELNVHANTDELTNVPNRRGFWRKGESVLKKLRGSEPAKLLLALMDLDNFKLINDHFGHETGDDVLREFAARLAQVVGSKGLVGRLGGDEFVVMTESIDRHDLHGTAIQILNAVNRPFTRENLQLPLRASMGVVEVCATDTMESAIHHADVAMYEGRANGCGGIFWYSDEFSKSVQDKADMMVRLEKAIESNSIEPHFQPMIDLATSDLVGFEALARWNDGERGMVRPDIFIGLAEELGLLIELDMAILTKTLDQLSLWHGHGKMYCVHVNVSAASIQQTLIERVSDELQRRAIDPKHLILELTETTIIENTDLVREVIKGLSAHGIKVQLDDFGTGYSSLSHIRDLPVSGIKIDRSFVGDTDGKARKVLHSVVNMALDLDLDIVAEGIEEEEQLVFLKNIRCKYAQGFYIGKPGTADVCEQLFPQLIKLAA